SFSYFLSESGSGILTAPLPRNPSVLPSTSTATPEPFSSAALRPDTTHWVLSAPTPASTGIDQPTERVAANAANNGTNRACIAVSSPCAYASLSGKSVAGARQICLP